MNSPNSAADNALSQVSISYPGVVGQNIFPQVPIQKQSNSYGMFIKAPEEKSAQVLMWDR